MTICPECLDGRDNYGKKGYCEICNKRIKRKMRVRPPLFGRFHKHKWELIASGNIKTPQGQFTIGLFKCKKCQARDWNLTGFIEHVENFERAHNIAQGKR